MKFLEKIFFNPKKTALYQHFKTELELVLRGCKDDKVAYRTQKKMNRVILKMVELCCRQDGDNVSLEKCQLRNLERLFNYYPLFPLEDNGDEWTKTDEIEGEHYIKVYYRHKRYPSLLKTYTVSRNTGEIVTKHYQDINNQDKNVTFPYYPVMREVR